jgi:hypothetical protein
VKKLIERFKRNASSSPELPGRFYGGTSTIHRTGHIDVEICDGEVVSVWFRCQPLPFEQHNVELGRADQMQSMYNEYYEAGLSIVGVQIVEGFK